MGKDKRRTSAIGLLGLSIALLLSACSTGKEESTTKAPAPSDSVVQTTATPNGTEAVTSATPDGAAATATVSPDVTTTPTAAPASTAPNTGEQKPEYLPADYPMPADAIITNSHSENSDGKKSVLLTYTTKESMADISALYKDYFQKKKLQDAAITSDERNLIIQGTTEDGSEQWSLIAGSLASQEGVIDITLTWAGQ